MSGSRLEAALGELVSALREEMRAEAEAAQSAPPALLDVEEAARALGLGRTSVYHELMAGRLRSVKVGRRRLVPGDALDEFAALLSGAAPLPPRGAASGAGRGRRPGRYVGTRASSPDRAADATRPA